MSVPLDWQRVRELFHASLDLAPEARLAFVKERADDALVANEVASLLAAYPAAEGFLSAPAGSERLAAAVAHLRPGDRLGAFEILGLIGSGGMGEVYRARDTRLDREVAIKVLSSDVGGDRNGRERLEREARAIAKLTHPRISTLHDVGSARIGGADATYLVMELVDGETLAARLRRGPLPLDQALAVAIDVAEALVAAHAAGIVHRDLKPANVMLTRSGAKLLDFGLARPRAPLAAFDSPTDTFECRPPTESAMAGTPAYMAPEQLRGVGADARSDLFAFGAMLYEMIAGRRAFDAESPADLIAAILEREPPALSTQVPALPPALDRLIATCLTKDADERWQTTRDLLRELRWVQDDSSARHAHPSMVTNPSRRTIAGVATLAIAAAVVGAFGLARVIRQPGPPPARVSFQIYPPAGTSFPRGAAEMAVSPDGSRLVFVALSADGRRKLWLRRFDAADSQPIDGSEDALDPFWSPDSRSIAFFAQNKLKRIAEGGGVAQDICQTHRGPRGGAWSRHGTILFGGWGEPLWRVSDTGGAPIQATALLESRLERQHGWPVFLPDGRRFLYLAASTDPAANAVFEGTLDGSDTRRVFAADSGVGIAGDYLITLSKGLLSARTYDAARVETGGAPMTIAEHIAYDAPLRSGPAFSVANGIVAFRNANPDSGLTWFDRKGHDLGSFPGRADFHHPWLSPDDKYIAVEKTDPATGQHTIWILDPLRGTSSRLLLSSSGAHLPVWSPDGRRIAFGSNRSRGVDLRDIAADGSGSDRVILDGNESSVHVTDWSLDGRFLLYHTMRGGQFDIFVVTLSPTVVAQPFLETPAEERQGQFSPDVHWIAYTSSESGSAEVYVRQFPDTGRKWQISTRGGAQPRWRRDGKELFYLARDGKLIAVSVAARPAGMEIGSPRALFDTGIRGSFLDRRNQFVVTRDGQRFLVNISAEDEDSAPITVMMNWDAAR